jgi:hypothetical protein
MDFKELQNIKLLRGKKRNNELNELSEQKRDFEFRTLFIEESEKTLHVIKSRKVVSEWIAIFLLLFASLFIQTPVVGFVLLMISIKFKLISQLFNSEYNKERDGFEIGLAIVNGVIKQDYGISLF